MYYYRIIPFGRSFDTIGLIYSSQEPQNFGTIVSIPFGSGSDMGIVAEEIPAENLTLDTSEIREIIAPMTETSLLEETDVALIDFIAEHYITPIHHVSTLFFPKNLIEKIHKQTYRKITPRTLTYPIGEITLSDWQQEIYKAISKSEKKKSLLYGVTWSGKTQIYMRLMADMIEQGNQTLLLIPEIILTSQIAERIQEVFWDDVLILHSGVSAAKKSQYWMDIFSWNAKIIIGTRSALFYPYRQLGMIIIDEEHDESYISDIAPRYNTLEVAEKISEYKNIPLLLGSGTPRVTTLYRAIQGELGLYQLLEKYKQSDARDNSWIVSTEKIKKSLNS